MACSPLNPQHLVLKSLKTSINKGMKANLLLNGGRSRDSLAPLGYNARPQSLLLSPTFVCLGLVGISLGC